MGYLMDRVRTTLVVALLSATVAAHGQAVSTYDCRHTSTAPVIDGDGGDSAWTRAPGLNLVDVEDLTGQRQHSRHGANTSNGDEDTEAAPGSARGGEGIN